ncbi:hypothetical protein MKS88_004187 [Plasmodium brasilianum]|uniref:Uncharacterized protein n=1 Tax=Plasmodium brasilianum TaxID=5824 RepID=A0ACB9Y6J2_PLABR|nr:hypothetical protein MKS88_004187 [Plasmodium brasilianum]
MYKRIKRNQLFVLVLKNDIKTKVNNTSNTKNIDYEIIKTVIRKEKEKNFKNIFLSVSLINISIFIFTFHNYYSKMNNNYYCHNDITIADHIVLNELVSSLGINNLSVYLENNFYKRLISNIQCDEYSFKENALLGLLELIYKSRTAFMKIEKGKRKSNRCSGSNDRNDEPDEDEGEKSFDVLAYIFEKLQGGNLESTKKKIYSCILFYYIKYSSEVFLTYEQIQELVYNENLFYCLNSQREEIISYLLFKVLKNDKCISEIYEREKKFIQALTQQRGYQTDKTDESDDTDKTDESDDTDKTDDTDESDEADDTDESDISSTTKRECNRNKNRSVIHFLLSYNKNKEIINEDSIWKLYYSLKQNNTNYYKQKTLFLLQNYLNNINVPFSFFFLKQNNITNTVIKKNSYNTIMNKIYLKYFENTVLYTFIFSFLLHNMNAKEYNLKSYFHICKDICRSIYSNCLINSLFLVEKSVINNLNGQADKTPIFITSLFFNLFNSMLFSLSIYKCKYGIYKKEQVKAGAHENRRRERIKAEKYEQRVGEEGKNDKEKDKEVFSKNKIEK